MKNILKTISYITFAFIISATLAFAAINIVPNGGTGVGTITGLIKGNGTSPFTTASAGTDYQAPITLTTTGTSGAATFTSNTLNIPQYSGTTYTAGTGLTLTGSSFSVNTSQNISTLSNLTVAGFVQTTSGGVLSSAALTSGQVTTALGFTPGTGNGTVTSVATDSTLTGGPITTTGTLGINLANPDTWTGMQIFEPTSTVSSGVGVGTSLYPTVNQSGSASYQALQIYPYLQATGSGATFLINAGTASAAGGTGTLTGLFSVTSLGQTTIGGATRTGQFNLGGSNNTLGAWGTTGAAFNIQAATYTDTVSTTGTVANAMGATIAVPTFAATNTGIIYTNAASLYIAGAPVAGTNVTITNPYALYSAAGTNFLATGFGSSAGARVGIGGAAGGAQLILAGGATTGTVFGTSGFGGISVNPATYSSTTSSGTIATSGINTFGIPTLTATSATTLTNAATVYIDGGPIASTNVTIGTAYALYVNGSGYFASPTVFNSSISIGSGSANLQIPSASTSAHSASAFYQFAGSSGSSYRTEIGGTLTTTITAGDNYANALFGSSPITTPATGTNVWLANMVVNPIGTVTAGGATVTNTASLYVGAASSAGTNNYAAYINGNIYGATTLSVNVPTATLVSNAWTAAFQSQSGTQNVVSLLRPANTLSNLLQFVPTGANTTTNVNWYMGMFANSDNFNWGYYNGTSSNTLMTISDTGNLGFGSGTGASAPSTLGYFSQSNGGGSGYTTVTVKNTSTAGRAEFALGTPASDYAGFITEAGSTTTNQANQFDIGNTLNGNFGMWTNNTQRVTILGNGNMSIGGNTTTATSLFNVGSTDQFQVSSTGNISTSGSLTLNTAGGKISIATGSNASVGTGTLSGGTVTINTTAVTASSEIFVTDTSSTTTNVGNLTVSAKTAGTSFVVKSTNASDASTFNWFIIN